MCVIDDEDKLCLKSYMAIWLPELLRLLYSDSEKEDRLLRQAGVLFNPASSDE